MIDKRLSVSEASFITGANARTLYAHIHKGTLPAETDARGRYYIDPRTCLEWREVAQGDGRIYLYPHEAALDRLELVNEWKARRAARKPARVKPRTQTQHGAKRRSSSAAHRNTKA